MTTIDEYSRYINVFFLSCKQQNTLSNIFRMLKFNFKRYKKVNEEIKKLIVEEGVQAQYRSLYSPQQNGIAEQI